MGVGEAAAFAGEAVDGRGGHLRIRVVAPGVADPEVIGEDGALRFRLEDGREFTSLSSAGKAVMGGVSCNGWRFWSIAGDRKPTAKKNPSARKRRAAASTIQRMENQTGASGDAVRYYCSACQEPFESPVGVVPTACSKGHSDNA